MPAAIIVVGSANVRRAHAVQLRHQARRAESVRSAVCIDQATPARHTGVGVKARRRIAANAGQFVGTIGVAETVIVRTIGATRKTHEATAVSARGAVGVLPTLATKWQGSKQWASGSLDRTLGLCSAVIDGNGKDVCATGRSGRHTSATRSARGTSADAASHCSTGCVGSTRRAANYLAADCSASCGSHSAASRSA